MEVTWCSKYKEVFTRQQWNTYIIQTPRRPNKGHEDEVGGESNQRRPWHGVIPPSPKEIQGREGVLVWEPRTMSTILTPPPSSHKNQENQVGQSEFVLNLDPDPCPERTIRTVEGHYQFTMEHRDKLEQNLSQRRRQDRYLSGDET